MNISTEKVLIEYFGNGLPEAVKDALEKIKTLEAEHSSLGGTLAGLSKKTTQESYRAQELQTKQLDLMTKYLFGQVGDEKDFAEDILTLQSAMELSRLWLDKAEDLEQHLSRMQNVISAKIFRAQRPIKMLKAYEELKDEVSQWPLRSDQAQSKMKRYAKELGLKEDCERFFAEVGAEKQRNRNKP